MTEELLYSVRGPKSWSEMTSGELDEALGKTDIVLVPVGAVEQHAEHLPLATDTYQAEEMARRAALNLQEDEGRGAIVGPSIPFGPVGDLRFPGSINISPTTMVALIKEYCYSLYRYGVKNILLILGHDVTLGALLVAARELAEETDDDLNVVVANWLASVKPLEMEMFDIPEGKRDGHGGAGETARILSQYPKLVLMDRARDYHLDITESEVPAGFDIVLGGGIHAPRKTTNRDPEFGGIVGFPSVATAEIGEKLYEAAGDWLAQIVKENFY